MKQDMFEPAREVRRARPMKRTIPGATLVLLLASGCGRVEPRSQAVAASPERSEALSGQVRLPAGSPQLERIKTISVEAKTVALDEVVAPGKIEANPTRVSRVSMPVPGRVQKVMVTIGEAVRQGEPVLSIASPDVGAVSSAYQQAEARVGQARAALSKAEADSNRIRDLYEHGAVAQKEVISANAQLAQAKAELQQAQAAREEALRRLQILGLKPGDFGQEVQVRAPVSGKVLDIGVASGEYRTDTSAPLMTIADLSTVYVAADVPESQIRLIHVGERVEVTLAAFPGEVFQARVARVADTLDPQSRTVKVRAELKNAHGRLRPEMFGQMRHEETFRRVAVVPIGAVIQSEDKSIVWRELAPGVFEPVPVSVGRRTGDWLPVLSGIREGDRVVVDGATLLWGAS